MLALLKDLVAWAPFYTGFVFGELGYVTGSWRRFSRGSPEPPFSMFAGTMAGCSSWVSAAVFGSDFAVAIVAAAFVIGYRQSGRPVGKIDPLAAFLTVSPP